MAFVPIVLGIRPSYPAARCTDIEVIYRSGDKRMRLENIPAKDAREEISKYGLSWKAYVWRWMDGLSDWEPVRPRGQVEPK